MLRAPHQFDAGSREVAVEDVAEADDVGAPCALAAEVFRHQVGAPVSTA